MTDIHFWCIFVISKNKTKIKDMKASNKITKRQAQAQGWIFITLGGGAISASKIYETSEGLQCISFNALTLATVLRKIANATI